MTSMSSLACGPQDDGVTGADPTYLTFQTFLVSDCTTPSVQSPVGLPAK